ncbi:MFS transporter [Nocardioides plantarum]|uniref:MFS transporter n=1 Tax=Nocardioides plantarum TaxID=29299 RepID=A0ABV5KFU5_9ACTN|nr:MFS transporter [Nocardioides plantarum]
MLSRLGFPAVGRHRAFVSALAIDALGGGIWMPLSLLYFLRQTDLTLVELGLVMTVANLAITPLVPLVGRLVDRLGPKSVMQVGNLLQGAMFALYPLVGSMVTVGLVVGLSTLGRTMFWGSNGPLVTQIAPPGEREVWFGFVQALRNAGYGVGGLLASVALTVGTGPAYDAVVLANAASYFVAFALMTGVESGGRPERAEVRRSGFVVVARDRGYRLLVLVIFLYALTEMTLNVTMPVYFADLLGLPGWVPGVVFVINTVMIGLGQGLVVRSMTGAIRSRVVLVAICFTASSFVMMLAADAFSVALATAVVLVAAVVYTVGEMVAGPVLGALSAEAAPDEHRGTYMSVVQLGWNLSSAVAPLAYASLLDLGAVAAWSGPLVLCAVWAACVVRLPHVLPRASTRVTNAAEEPSPESTPV